MPAHVLSASLRVLFDLPIYKIAGVPLCIVLYFWDIQHCIIYECESQTIRKYPDRAGASVVCILKTSVR